MNDSLSKLAEQNSPHKSQGITEANILITELCQSEQFNQQILDSSDDCIKVFDLEGRILFMSQVGQGLLGIQDITPFLNTSWAEFWQGTDQQAAIEAIALARSGEVATFQGYLPKLGSKPKWWDNKISPIRGADGQVERLLCISRDITKRRLAEEALRESEAKYRRLFESMDQGFCICEMLFDEDDKPANYRFLEVNAAFEQLTGLEQVVGKTIQELVPDHESYWFEIYGRVVRTREPVRFEQQSIAMKRWFDINAFCIGKPQSHQFAALFTNITEAKRIEAERKQAEIALQQTSAELESQVRKFNATLSTITDFVFSFDRDGRFLYANQVLLDVWGITAAEAIGKTMAELNYPPTVKQQVLNDLQRVLETGQSVRNETPYTNPAGIEGYFEYILSPVITADRTIESVVGLSRDISDRKQIEAERERLLQQEQAAREEAQRANQTKDEFLAVLSHELRSPLNPILGWSRLLQNGKLDAVKTQLALKTIERNAQIQAKLIEDLLDMSRILQGKLSLNVAPVNLASTIEAASETIQLAAEAKSIKVDSNFEPDVGLVFGDSTRLQQVIWNLLSNAVKFTPQGGLVSIHLERLDSYAYITVSDTGQGIESDFLPYVFDYFRQANATTTRKFGGLGLGLAIVQNLVELHGGTVKVKSPGVGMGATFTVKLPLMPIQATANQNGQLSEPSADLKGIQVLVVDDEADSREFVAFVLEQAGATVLTATTAAEALTMLTRSKPTVLLSDIGMPDMDGYMLIQQVRALPAEQGGQVKAIALTAYAGDFNQQQALQAGFQQHISKPIEPERLIQVISRLLEVNL